MLMLYAFIDSKIKNKKFKNLKKFFSLNYSNFDRKYFFRKDEKKSDQYPPEKIFFRMD
jgi:hypothetical protein